MTNIAAILAAPLPWNDRAAGQHIAWMREPLPHEAASEIAAMCSMIVMRTIKSTTCVHVQ